MKKILMLPVVVAIFSIAFFSIQIVTAASTLDITGVQNFAILATTYTNSGAGTVLNGDLGYTVAPANPPTVSGKIFVSSDTGYIAARAIQAGLITSANDPAQSGSCTVTRTGATVLDSLPQPLTPGVYCITGGASINTGVTLDGDGIYIFRISGTLNTAANSMVNLGNAHANNVFWVPMGATTLGANTSFAGNVLSNAAITLLSTVNLNGRILSNGAVTTTGPSDIITSQIDIGIPSTVQIGNGTCTGDCIPPTLGLNGNGVRMVVQGFSYNGHISDVGSSVTSYPLVTTKVGVANKAVFKIYEDGGPDEIRHFDLAFGLAKGQTPSDSKVRIEWNKSSDGTETTKVVDPAHAIKDVKVETSTAQCKSQTPLKNDCLVLSVYHTFVTPLAFNGIATNVWDEKQNAWQNYWSPGVQVTSASSGTNTGAKVILSPLKQLKAGVAAHNVECKAGFELIVRTSTNTPICVTLATKQNLVERGWTKP